MPRRICHRTRPRLAPAALALLALGLAGCTTIPPEERAATCAKTDWERFGENDGRLGIATSERADQFEDCQDLGQPVNLAAYQTGRATGLAEYCTVENGYQVGLEGRRYRGVCPPDLEPDFEQGYAQGRKDRPITISPSIGIGVGSGGRVRTGVGIGVGLFRGTWGYGRHRYYRPYGYYGPYGLSRWYW